DLRGECAECLAESNAAVTTRRSDARPVGLFRGEVEDLQSACVLRQQFPPIPVWVLSFSMRELVDETLEREDVGAESRRTQDGGRHLCLQQVEIDAYVWQMISGLQDAFAAARVERICDGRRVDELQDGRRHELVCDRL